MSQVRTELAASGAISLGQASVRALAGIASGPISLSNLYGKSAGSYFSWTFTAPYGYLNGPRQKTTMVRRGMAVDSSGNMYFSEYYSPSVNDGVWVYKVSKTGSIVWTRYYFITTTSATTSSQAVNFPDKFVIGTDGFLYGFYDSSSAMYCKINTTDGTLAWYKVYSNGGYSTPSFRGYSIAPRVGGGVLLGGQYLVGTGNNVAEIIAFNPSTGLVDWGVSLKQPTNSTSADCRAIDTDASGNIYALLMGITVSTMVLVKLNSSGAFQWGRVIASAYQVSDCDVRCSPDGSNVVVIYQSYPAAYRLDIAINKFDSSGNLSWQREIGYGTGYTGIACRSIDIDTDNSIYVLCNKSGASITADVFAYKLNSNGTFNFCTKITSPTRYLKLRSDVNVVGAEIPILVWINGGVLSGGSYFTDPHLFSIKSGAATVGTTTLRSVVYTFSSVSEVDSAFTTSTIHTVTPITMTMGAAGTTNHNVLQWVLKATNTATRTQVTAPIA